MGPASRVAGPQYNAKATHSALPRRAPTLRLPFCRAERENKKEAAGDIPQTRCKFFERLRSAPVRFGGIN